MDTLPPFQHLLDAHARDVHGFLVALLGPDDADDGFQETILAALRAYPDLEHARGLRGWLFTIAYRKAVDATRRRSHAAVPTADLPDVAVTDRDPLVDGDLWAAVERLPTKQRAAVLHRYRDDLAYDRVAALLGCSPDAARRNASDGIRRLRQWMS